MKLHIASAKSSGKGLLGRGGMAVGKTAKILRKKKTTGGQAKEFP